MAGPTLINRRIAVIGAHGFAGRAIAGALRAAEADVVAISRIAAAGSAEDNAGCDAADAASLTRALRGCDAAVNAITGGTPAELSAVHTLAGLVQSGALPHVVQISTLAVNGAAEGVFSESSTPRPAIGHRYAARKLQAECVLLSALGTEGTVSILRPGCVYGPGAPIWVDGIARLLLDRRLGWLGAQGEGVCSLLHVNDLARAVVAALAAGRVAAGVHHVVAPEALTWNWYFRRLGGVLGIVQLPRISRLDLMVETWVIGPVRLARAKAGGAPVTVITPAMRRLFACASMPVSVRPLLRDAEFTGHGEGLAEAAADFLARDPGTRRRARMLSAKQLAYVPAAPGEAA
jgi:nucleoside-diphosphate-sugar epimerase